MNILVLKKVKLYKSKYFYKFRWKRKKKKKERKESKLVVQVKHTPSSTVLSQDEMGILHSFIFPLPIISQVSAISVNNCILLRDRSSIFKIGMVVEELLVGAALGALLGELLKGVMNLMEKSVHFKPELELLKSQIEFLQPLVDQVDELGEDFKLRYSDQTLKILIRKGKQLIRECNDAAIQNTLSRYFKIQLCYTKDLRRLDAELKRAGSNLRLELYVQQMKKLQALEINYNNDGRYGRILDRAKLIVTSILTHVGYNFTFVTNILDKLFSGESGSNNNKYNIKLPLLFYHDQRLKGKLYISLLIIIIASSSYVFLIIYINHFLYDIIKLYKWV